MQHRYIFFLQNSHLFPLPNAIARNLILQTGLRLLHISATDNGIGFDQQYSEKIFEVFQRLRGRNQYYGTGIGLSIVKKIVENHEGIITTHSELNKGATFDIYIPAN
ncbi:MAG: ATP-binding protein [Ferruginibacter sp.]